jgi:Ca2+-binding RTX toxin-like protein
MPELTFIERLTSGHGSLDWGITGLTVLQDAGGATLFSTSGPRGGIVSYTLSPGAAVLADFDYFGGPWSSDVLPEVRVVGTTAAPLIVVSAGGESGIWTYAPDVGGLLDGPSLLSGLPTESGPALDIVEEQAGRLFLADGLEGSILAYDWSGTGYGLSGSVADTPDVYADGIVRLQSIERAGQEYLITAGQGDRGATAFLSTETTLVATGSLGEAEGLGVMVPTDLATARIGGRDFVLLGSAANAGGGGAISVMELRPSGALLPVDHVIDTADTRFGDLLSLDVVAVDDRTYVVAAGGDDGLTLFTLLPDGRLHLLDVIASDVTFDLGNVTTLTGWWDGTALRIFAASEMENGIAAYVVPLDDQGLTLGASDSGGVLDGGALDDLLMGGLGQDTLIGDGGNDILIDGAGSDLLYGGSGADRFVLSADGAEDEIADFDPALDRLDLSAWPMLYDSAQLSILPTATGAQVTWQDETLTLTRSGGGPITEAEVIAAIIDTPHRQPFLASIGGPGVAVSGGEGSDTISGGPGMDRLFGLDGNDTLDGLGSEDEIAGGAGDDVITGGEGADVLDGGLGRDTASYSGSGAGVTVRLWAGDGAGGDAAGDRLTGIEDLVGSAFADTLVGDFGDNALRGGDGADALWGNAGDDTLIGGQGADVINGQDGWDTASYAGSPEAVIVRLWAGDGTGGDAQGDTLSGIEALIGSEHADTLVGDPAANMLIGGDGADALWGNAGDDTFEGGAGGDLLQGQDGADWASYATSDAAITVRLWSQSGSGGHAEGDTLIGIEHVRGSDHDDTLVGDDGGNRLLGGDGADALWGNSGDDTLEGGAGADLLDGQSGSDWASYAASDSAVTVRLWAGTGTGGDAEGDTLRGIENLQGSAHADTLVGSNGANRFDGGAGNDDIWANDGDDTLEGGAGADVLRGQGGRDTASYAGSAEGVTVRLWAGDGWGGDATGDALIDIENAEGSAHDDILSGSGGDNVLSGLGGRDQIWAGDGNDTLWAETGDDVLRGQGGDDLLFGGPGADVFVFADGDGTDRIADFGDGDRIDLRGVWGISSFDDLQDGAATDTAEGLRIDTGNGVIFVIDQSLANLDLTDFLF